ncbi:MAG: WYL domain-containing protein [Anaerotignum sp.]|nr:WYL domain-containing protein [Anaerotignum sp.]
MKKKDKIENSLKIYPVPKEAKHGRKPNQRMKPYLIYQFLLRNSNENKTITADNIAAYLSADCGVDAERHSVYKDIDAMNKAIWMLENNATIEEAEEAIDNDFDHEEKAIVYKHRHGFYARNIQFEPTDLQLLAECINSAKFISRNQAKELKKKLGKLTNKYEAKELRSDVYLVGRNATSNDYVRYYIPTINEAIKNNHKIRFYYMKHTIQNRTQQVARRKGEKYTLSPFKMLISDGNYYLLAYDSNYKKILTFRIDRMKGVEELQEMREGEEEYKKIDIDSYNQRVFSMFGGDQKRVTMRFTNRLLDAVVEKLGNGANTHYRPSDDWHFVVTADIEVSDQFYGWICGLRKNVTIIDPPDVVEGFKDFLSDISLRYEPKDDKKIKKRCKKDV